MSQDDILSRLQDVFNDTFLDPVLVTPDLDADQVEEWDSLTHISLIVAVENVFGIQFRTGEVEGTGNVGEFAALIERRIAETTPAS